MKAIWAAALLALVGGSVADAAAPQRAATHKTVKSRSAKHRKARRPRHHVAPPAEAVAEVASCIPPATPIAGAVPTPLDLYGPIFTEVQQARLFPDSKSFADATPLRARTAILADWCATHPESPDQLHAFVQRNFAVPMAPPIPAANPARPPVQDHIAALWPHLTRPPLAETSGGSALALPERYVVPGGRFREMYYWDSYFTMLGLKADGHGDLVESMLDDFVSLVERYGHIPNGTRTYYVERSQPPMLYLMLALSDANDPALEARRLVALRREHDFWMQPERVVTMPDGSVLNRYYSHADRPREESWREDVALQARTKREAGPLYRDIRAAAESGWDFSSRWFADGKTLATIDTTNVVPVDLNSLLYGMEGAIAEQCRAAADAACATRYDALAAARKKAVETWLWDDKGGRYGDWDIAKKTLRRGLTAATAFPLFTGLAASDRADLVAATIGESLVAPGGLRTTLARTGEQWDTPNGWPPLQWIAIEGLNRTGHETAARELAQRFLATVLHEYRASGRMLEKYDVEQARPGGGGEYPLQDGFGWTNGVVRALIARYGKAQ
ncbi:alpha,alpha-trehalase TreF [Sphingomonas populi]|uniref:Alpha,alpha-trehalase TreF n=1 Tax=Sphingomonas populi TaxID=2484750 RepID=A0A4Q6Y8C3_9SPHN|nr:alpha,alpha-trehalase TreF [Sphingomonas populi]RZF65566.1 alpha,alpha-trehalase TreF [Sphingomonas populi]